MRRLFLILIIIPLLTGCASQPRKAVIPEAPVGRYLKIPQWFINIPEGDFTFGFAKLTVNKEAMMISALQDATVTYCRNHNCYVVNKRAIRDTQIGAGSGEQEFQVIVSSEPQQLYDIRDRLQLLDYFWFYDNFIGIFSLGQTQIDSTRIDIWCEEAYPGSNPEWYIGDLIVEEEQVLCDVHTTSSDLIDAWQKAVDKGRVKLAGYNKIKVDASVWHINNERDKLISLETSLKMNQIEIDKIYFRRYYGSGGPAYSVWLRMSMEKGV
ncbi:MAG: hypothetical protein RAO94_02920 [Candidatus Stygibacter australis]|nr:hypothetical protein [Candidatus Stygibacter australis]MDP8321286.1 hypothetical protein [Candidatus Stygibacter australis]